MQTDPPGLARPHLLHHAGTWLPLQGDGLAGLRGVTHAILVYRAHSEDIRLPFLQIQKGESRGFHRSFCADGLPGATTYD